MNEFLQLILKQIEEKTSWGRNELRTAILEEYGKMGQIRTILQGALSPAITDKGRVIVIDEALKAFHREM